MRRFNHLNERGARMNALRRGQSAARHSISRIERLRSPTPHPQIGRPRTFTSYLDELVNELDAQALGGMATPAPADEVNEVHQSHDPSDLIDDVNDAVVKRNDSERGGSAPVIMDAHGSQHSTPAHFPLSTQEQLQAMARRREAAVCFKCQVEECRLALKYSVIGWTGTLDPAKIPAALSNAPSIRDLDRQLDTLERKLAPFLPPNNANGNDNPNNLATNFQGLGPESLGKVERVRSMLLQIIPGTKSTRHIRPVADAIEQEARDEGILPPEDNLGWVWSLSFDDWFIWHAGEEVFVSAKHDIRTDFVAA